MVRGWSALALTMRCMSLKELILVPSMVTTMSRGLKPARSAALPGLTVSTLAAVIRLPKG